MAQCADRVASPFERERERVRIYSGRAAACLVQPLTSVPSPCPSGEAGTRAAPTKDMDPILGLDYGRARIGVTISDELQLLAHPLETIPANEQAAFRVAEIVREKKVDHVVTGLPKRMDGQIGAAATEVLLFVEKLRAILPCPVVTWDERLTTVAAHRALRDAGKKTRHTRGYVDQVAAQMILQSYLDSRAASAAARK
jgi:putative pre-16S rRNA nuclease